MQDATAMTAMWIGAAHNHLLQSGSASPTYAKAHDRAVLDFANMLFGLEGGDLDSAREVAGCPTRLGAWDGSWQSGGGPRRGWRRLR